MRVKRTNRRIDKSAGPRWRRRVLWAFCIAGASWIVLGMDARLPRVASMGIQIPTNALWRTHSAGFELPEIDWRAWLRTPSLELRRVHFIGLRSLDAARLTEQLALTDPKPLIDVSPAAICEQLEATGRIADCTAVRIPPQRLAIAVKERVPVAVIAQTRRGVDDEATSFPLEPGEGEDLPRISGDVERALRFVDAASHAGIELEKVEARAASEPRPHVILWPKQIRMRILPGDDPTESFRRLRELLPTNAAAQPGMELDLRFRGRAFLREVAPSNRENEGEEA